MPKKNVTRIYFKSLYICIARRVGDFVSPRQNSHSTLISVALNNGVYLVDYKLTLFVFFDF